MVWQRVKGNTFACLMAGSSVTKGTISQITEANSMKLFPAAARKMLLAVILAIIATSAASSQAQPASGNQAANATNDIRILELQGTVEVSPAGAATWVLTQTNQVIHPFDRLRTGPNSRVTLRWSDQSVVLFGALTELEILPPHQPEAQSGLHLIKGILSFFHRDKPGRIRVITRGAVAGVEGTEFVMAVDEIPDSERTTLWVIDGKVRFGNEQAELVLTNGQLAVAEPGKAPLLTAGFIANNVLQWCFFYPAVLDLGDLPWPNPGPSELEASLNAYRAGDLLAALAKYPAGRHPASEAESIYYAALLLSVGQVAASETALAGLHESGSADRIPRLANALRTLIAAVKRQPNPSTRSPELSTELLAASYYEQSLAARETSLARALDLAKRATTNSPQSGFAWERVAELEFSFGRIGKALEDLDQSLALAPRNAEALALKGFLLAGQNRTKEAIGWFDQSLAVDSALGNAWLGRGLCRIRRGDSAGGREDLLVAAALEPQRAVLRSYLGKAYANEGDFTRATKELQLAKHLDENDPTAWLYSALLKQQQNRINEAVEDLEKSEELNENRSVYRSGLLLDQDQAVRSANLAGIYRDAGMFDVSVREASKAVNYDYGNYSAHLFLADSFNQSLDLISRRYETATEAEFLLANLLAPAGAGTLSPTVSQLEYSRLFEQNRLGIVSSTEYLSRGAWTQSGAQYGRLGNISYNFDAIYAFDPGQRKNDDQEVRSLALQLKLDITPNDNFYILVTDLDSESGDVAQFYTPNMASPAFRIQEKQDPIVGIGYHHEWSPGVHTIMFATRLTDTFSLTNPAQPTLVAFRPDVDPVNNPGVTELTSVQGITMHERFHNNLEIYSAELQQIWQERNHDTIVGVRLQYGHLRTSNLQALPSTLNSVFPDPPAPASQQDDKSLFRRVSVYGYHQWQILDSLQLSGGVTYDRLTFPENFRTAPISDKEETLDQVSPKAGMIWTPFKDTTVRFAYTRSLAGATLDQSFQLEPSQVAGFVQSYRSIIPESVEGANAGARFETYGVSLEQKFPSGTYIGISGEILDSQVHRTLGTFDVLPDELDFAIPSGLREDLDYRERSIACTVNQLVGKEWSFGGRYRISHAELKDDFINVPNGLLFVNFEPRQNTKATLHRADLFAIFNHISGLFAEADASWYAQSNQGYSPDRPGDSFWQFNLFAGYRFPARKAEVQVGLLNISDQDYSLNPLNAYSELPRKRTLAVRFQFSF